MDAAELNVRLPKSDIDFVKAYATKHKVSVDEVIDRSLKLLQRIEEGHIHPDVLAISGLVPADVDAEVEYRDHLLRKHR